MAGNLLDDVKKYFTSQSLTASIPTVVGSTLGFGRNLFIGREPSSPVNCITIYPTAASLRAFLVAQRRRRYRFGLGIRRTLRVTKLET